MTPRRVPARSRLLRRSRSIGGLPPIPVAIGLIAAALLGIMLTIALQNSLAVSGSQQGAPMNGDPAPGKNASGIRVVTEADLGAEVQRLVDNGSQQDPASFNVAQCLDEQQILDPLLMMEEIEWDEDGGTDWLIVHGPTSQEVLNDSGGMVNATVVTSGCGTGSESDATASRLWSGSVKIAPK